MILWINIRVEYSILSFNGHIPVSISSPVERTVIGICNILFNDWFHIFSIVCISLVDIFSHTSNPYNIAGMRHVSKSLIFTLIFSCLALCFDDIPFICLIILFTLFSVSLCALLDYLLCLALFLSKYMYLLLQSFFPLNLLFFLVTLFQLLLSYILSFSVHTVFCLCFHFSAVFYYFFYCVCIPYCCNIIYKDGHTYFYIAIFTCKFFTYCCSWCTAYNGSICQGFP